MPFLPESTDEPAILAKHTAAPGWWGDVVATIAALPAFLQGRLHDLQTRCAFLALALIGYFWLPFDTLLPLIVIGLCGLLAEYLFADQFDADAPCVQMPPQERLAQKQNSIEANVQRPVRWVVMFEPQFCLASGDVLSLAACFPLVDQGELPSTTLAEHCKMLVRRGMPVTAARLYRQAIVEAVSSFERIQAHHTQLRLSLPLPDRRWLGRGSARQLAALCAKSGLAPEFVRAELGLPELSLSAARVNKRLARFSEVGLQPSLWGQGEAFIKSAHLQNNAAMVIRLDSALAMAALRDVRCAKLLCNLLSEARQSGLKTAMHNLQALPEITMLGKMGLDYASGPALARALSPLDTAAWVASQQREKKHHCKKC
ncbi:EAL domain-containing protein [Polycladidibacter hongkongensis]|uniref:EAL domain-containing protein n=1 Tax=Polycladidibacter hongkongensis TaxID=1647556 RepID=UPI00083463FD|nr:EAL domain-containing protein [Pseudovibrio hongkongensis]